MGIVFVSNPQIKPGALTLYHCPGEKTPQLNKGRNDKLGTNFSNSYLRQRAYAPYK